MTAEGSACDFTWYLGGFRRWWGRLGGGTAILRYDGIDTTALEMLRCT
jgi:hypothetical protein